MPSLAARVGACLTIVCALLIGASAQARGAAPRAQRRLQRTLSHDLALAGGSHGALVVDLETGQTLYSASPSTPRLPASVEKLYTTSTALQAFGPGASLGTTVLGAGALDSTGTFHGTIYLHGGGDPTFGSAGFDTYLYGTGVGATVQRLAGALRSAGVRRIAGGVAGDESYFDSLRGTPATGFGPDLEVEGELSALAYDDGFVSTAETALQPRPALFATQQFVSAMRAAGIRGPSPTRVYTARAPTGAKRLAVIHSPRIATLIKMTNTPSDNFFAETLLKDLGAAYGAGGTTAAGAGVVRSVIAATFGLHPQLNDGSGLSRYDHTSPAQIVTLLQKQQSDRDFVGSLAVAGVSGTMQDEMLGSRAVGNCRGKTGTLIDVANLVGYCTARNGDTLAFAFMMQGISDTNYGHSLEDEMGVALANYNGPGAAQSVPGAA